MRLLRSETLDELHTPHVRCGYSRWTPGQGCLPHAHQDAVELFIVLGGAALFTMDAGCRLVRAGSTFYVGPGQRHELAVVGDEPLLTFWAVTPHHVPTHTFFRENGTSYSWEPPEAGSTEAARPPFWLVERDVPAIDPADEAHWSHTPLGVKVAAVLAPETDRPGVWNRYLRADYARWSVGQDCELHAHQDAAEVFVFIAGACRFTAGDETREVAAGCTVFVEPEERHRLVAIGDRPLDMFLAVTPNHSPTHTFFDADGQPVHRDRQPPPWAE